MACAGRGRVRGLLQSVMTEGNKQLQLGHSGSCCGAPFPLSLSLSAAAVVVCTLEPRRMTVRKHQMAAGSRRSKQWTTTTGDDGVVCNCCQSCCLAAVHDRVWFIFFLGCLCGQNIDTQVPTGPCPLLLLLFLSLLFIGAAPAEASTL